jgi:enoyl-[acyl-carrier protein] reductase II
MQPERTTKHRGTRCEEFANVANTDQVAGRMADVKPVADIIAGMWASCREVLAQTAGRVGLS